MRAYSHSNEHTTCLKWDKVNIIVRISARVVECDCVSVLPECTASNWMKHFAGCYFSWLLFLTLSCDGAFLHIRTVTVTESLLYAITGRELANSTKHKNIGQD